MGNARKYVAIGIVLLFLCLAVQPAVVGELPDRERPAEGQGRGRDEVPAPFRTMGELASRLLNTTNNNTDTDKDGLPDNVERALGTEPESNDSDFDRLDDRYEVFNGLDPNMPDSNDDGMPDLIEVTGVPRDLDSDGVPNAWDWDNDDDGVMDYRDYSPFSKSSAASSFRLDINISDQPTFVTFQFRPKDADHLRLILQSWDWPNDTKGSFMDLNGSRDDLDLYPMLEFRAERLPDAQALAAQGITVSGGVAYLPVLPISEFGNIVAFKARMFYPESASFRNISANVSFFWKVLGKTDVEVKALRLAESSNYLSADTGGKVSVNGPLNGDNELFDWIKLPGSSVALRATDGKYLAVGANKVLMATQSPAPEKMCFSVEELSDNKTVFKAGDCYLTVKANGSVVADATSNKSASQFLREAKGFRSDTIQMASYGEDILLTGCRVEEDFGATAGVLYGSNESHTVLANLAMDYDFLRNATLGLDKVPGHLRDRCNITLSHNIASFGTYEEALAALASSMPKDALGRLPNGTHLPIISAMEDKGRSVDLSAMASGGYVKGSRLVANCAIYDVITTRTLKTTWYNTSTDKPMELWEISAHIARWDTTAASKVNTLIMMLTWTAGEQRVVSIGNVIVDFSSELGNINIDTTIIEGMMIGMDFIGELLEVADNYCFNKWNKCMNEIQIEWSTLGQSKTYEQFSYKWNNMAKNQKTINKVSKFIGVLEKLGTCLEIVGLVIDFVLIGFVVYAIIDTFGLTPTGLIVSSIVGVLTDVWVSLLAALAIAGGPIGAVISTVLGMLDAMWIFIIGTTGSEWIINKIVTLAVKWFSKIRRRSNLDLEVRETATEINDTDNNGLDVEDIISYRVQFYGNVTLTKHGTSKDLTESLIKPSLSVYPFGFVGETSNYTKQISSSSDSQSKTTVYESGVSVVPEIACENFPLSIQLLAEYKFFYDDCWFRFITKRQCQSNFSASDWTALYFDVMPNSIARFLDWSTIRSNDIDGDGINNTDENGTANGTSAWNWDTDADGLGDRYELDIGTDPVKADTDGDGLDDSCELKLGTNCSSNDTDKDGLSDFAEVSGAVISFDFCGSTVHYLTNSDPRLNDTDGDGVADPLEYYCLLNPRSADTNGDGLNDRMADYGDSSISYAASFNQPWPDASYPFITQSPDGHIFGVLIGGPSSNTSLIKYNTDGTVERIWTPSVMIADIAIDDHGFVYVLTWDTSEVIKYDASMNKVANWSVTGHNKLAIDSRAHILYVSDDGVTIRKYHLNNMTLMESIVLPTYNPWYPGMEKMDVDGDGNLLVPYNNSIFVYSKDGELVTSFGSAGKAHGQLNQPMGVRRCRDGDIVVADMLNLRIQKFSPFGECRVCYPEPENYSLISGMNSICVIDDCVYVPYAYDPVFCIKKFSYALEINKVNQATNFTDTDGDGMTDGDELLGWNVTVAASSSGRAPVTYHVTSDPNMTDTDGDGLSDNEEAKSFSDARRIDTDTDGASDRMEKGLGTKLTDWDSDGDRLGDGTEPMFGSDPLSNDTDGEGLDDMQELLVGSNPKIADSDCDSLDDYNERLFGSSPTDPDSDDDVMFDAAEKENGTDPNIGDTDADGLVDGHETLYGTDPKGNDTDGDGPVDGFEIDEGLDPLCNDTDGDGLTDGYEIVAGLDPFSPDSDGDGVSDSLDTDSAIALDDDIILVADGEEDPEAFWSSLSKEATVVNATPQELVGKYGGEPYIVLVGRPEAPNGTAGALVGELLAGTGETLDTAWEHIVVRYGVWATTQTVVMLSEIEPNDALQVLGILKSMRMTVTPDRVTARYLNPRSDFELSGMDSVRATGSAVLGQLDGMTTFNVTVSRYKTSGAPANLTYGTGLEPGDHPLDSYLDISLAGGGRDGNGLMDRTLLELYYTTADLDRNGDGDADDPGDINESSLSPYRLDGTGGNWSRLVAGQDGVDGLEVNTTDFELYGTQYQGAIWVNLTRLGLLGLGGKTNGGNLPVSARAGDDRSVYSGDEALFNGTLSTGNGAIANFTWTFHYDDRTVTLFGPVASFVFQVPGTYNVTLTVRDLLGLAASDTLTVAVQAKPGENFTLEVGPVKDKDGKAIEGALVTINVGGKTYANNTDAQGIVRFVLPLTLVGKGVSVRVEKKGYTPAVFDTNITSDRKLGQNPPALKKVVQPGPQEGSPPWALGAAAIAIILLVLLAALFMRRKPSLPVKGGPEAKEREGIAGEGPKEGPPPAPPIERTEDKPDEIAAPEPAAQENIGEMRKAGGNQP